MSPSNVTLFFTSTFSTPLARANWAKTGFDAAAATTAFPLRRPGEPEEVARTVLFMASDAASYITGQTVHVNGGAYF